MVLSMDGKEFHGPDDMEVSDELCLLAAYLPGKEITLAKLTQEDQQNEITGALLLWLLMDLRNKVVSGNALYTQSQASIRIKRAGDH